MFIGYDNALYVRRAGLLCRLLLLIPSQWLLITQARVDGDYMTWVRVSFKSNP